MHIFKNYISLISNSKLHLQNFAKRILKEKEILMVFLPHWGELKRIYMFFGGEKKLEKKEKKHNNPNRIDHFKQKKNKK